jgi:hopanoid biosynthesis associated RND transporter like protein HpnN
MTFPGWLALWVRWIVRARWAVVLLSVASAVLCLRYTASELRMSTTTSGMFADDVPFRVNYEDFTASFPQFVDTLLVVVDGETAAMARARAGAIVARTTAEPEVFKSVYWPGADPYFRRNGLLFLEIEQLNALRAELAPFAPLFNALLAQPSLPRLAEILTLALRAAPERMPERLDALLDELARALERARAGTGPPQDLRRVLLGSAGSELGGLEGTRELVLIQPVLDYRAFPPGRVPMQRLREIADEVERQDGGSGRIRLTGEIALTHEEFESARRGAMLSVAISLLLVVLLLVMAFRSARFLLVSLATIAIGFAWTSAYATAAVGHLNLISMAFAALYAGMGVDSSIHFCLHLREVMNGGSDRRTALERTAAEKGVSLAVAAVTTALAFLSFWPTDFDGVAELGIIAGGGMLIGLFANLTVLPALLAIGPSRPSSATRPDPVSAWSPSRFPWLRRPRLVRVLSVALFLLALPALALLRFHPDPHSLRDRGTESVQAFEDLLANPRTSPHRLQVVVEASESSAASPEGWAARKAALAALPSVESVVSSEDLIPRDQAQKLEVLKPLARLLVPPELGSSGVAEEDSPMKAAESLRRLQEALEKRLGESARGQGVDRLHRSLEETLGLGEGEQARVLSGCEEDLIGGLIAEMSLLKEALSTDGVERLPPEVARWWIDERGRERMEVLPAEPLGSLPAKRRFVGEVVSLEPAATGGPVVLLGAGKIAVASLRRAFAFAAVSIALVLALSLRSARAVALAAFPVVLGGVLTLAICGISGIALNFANMIGLPLLLGLAIDSGVHIVHRTLHQESIPGGGAINLLQTSTGKAVFYSSLTTISGFVSLVLSPHWGTASLGWLMSLGMALTLVVSLVALPAWLAPRNPGARG